MPEKGKNSREHQQRGNTYVMRALGLMLRRILQKQSKINSSSGSDLHHQPRYYYSPHLDYLNLAKARAFTLWPTCRLRTSQSLPFSNLAGKKGGAEEEGVEVLDMDAGTVRCAANYAPLTPISFIERAATVYGGRAAVVYGERRRTWAEERDRCVRAAAALATQFGVARGDVVSCKPRHRSRDPLAVSTSRVLFFLLHISRGIPWTLVLAVKLVVLELTLSIHGTELSSPVVEKAVEFHSKLKC